MINGRTIGYMPTGSYAELSVEQVCESLRRIGYDAVEWTMHFASPRSHTAGELRRLADTTREYGLTISEVVVQWDLVLLDEDARRDNIALIKQCIESYADVGIDTINLFTGPVPWVKTPLAVGAGISEGSAWGMVFSAFDELVPFAEKKRMNLAVENVWGMLCHDFYTMKYLVDHYRSPFLGVNYDPSHDILAGHADIGWIVRSWGGGDIKHVHLKDAAGIDRIGRFVFPLPGEGELNWKEFFAALRQVGYAGAMSVEFESFAYVSRILKGDWEKAAQIAFDNLTLLLED